MQTPKSWILYEVSRGADPAVAHVGMQLDAADGAIIAVLDFWPGQATNAPLIAAAPAMRDMLQRIADTPCDHGAMPFCPRESARTLLRSLEGN